jgi:peptidoglycan/xylan/chitin deacetylase (PgdA/CDA1 family)
MISVHIDIDNIWNYEREFAAEASQSYDAIYDQALGVMLDTFRCFDVKATFFVTGVDLKKTSCREFCLRAVSEGHELANHTYNHFDSFYRLSFSEKESEIKRCGDAIEALTNKAVRGFRAPGYYLDDEIVEILIKESYLYDTSVLPSFAGLLMGPFIAMKTGRRLDKSFGRRRFAIVSQNITKIFSRTNPEKFVYELPITSLPIVRMPVHSTFIYMLGQRYLAAIKATLPLVRRPIVYLFHAIDTIDETLYPNLRGKVPALSWPLSARAKLFEDLLTSLSSRQFVTATELVASLSPTSVARSKLLSLPMRSGNLESFWRRS